MSDEELFRRVLELGRRAGWHDGTGRSKHYEYVQAGRRRRRARVVGDADEALIARHRALMVARVAAEFGGGELASLVRAQAADEKYGHRFRRSYNVVALDDPLAQFWLRRRAMGTA